MSTLTYIESFFFFVALQVLLAFFLRGGGGVLLLSVFSCVIRYIRDKQVLLVNFM